MALDRVPEPELMNEPAQAAAYSDADFADAHQGFVDEIIRRFAALHEGNGVLLDVGCGPGDVTVRLARACPGWSIIGVDGAAEMLRLGRERVTRCALDERVRLELALLPSAELSERRFDALVSNSLLHHLADPQTLWGLASSCLADGAPVAVMDLRRPDSDSELDRLVHRYATGAPAVLRDDFRNSLRAAYRPDEVIAQLGAAGLDHLRVETPSDRHLLVTGRR